MSNLNLIATEKDNQIYNINTIANNLDWVLPSNIINSTSSLPIKYKQYKYIKNLANSCIYNQLVKTNVGPVSGCSLLWNQIILVNPSALPVVRPSPLSTSNTNDSPKEIPINTNINYYYIDNKEDPYNEWDNTTDYSSTYSTTYSFSLIFILILFFSSMTRILYYVNLGKNKKFNIGE
jgi:hypothetical protein